MSNSEKLKRKKEDLLDDIGRRENDLINIIGDEGELPERPDDLGEPDDLN